MPSEINWRICWSVRPTTDRNILILNDDKIFSLLRCDPNEEFRSPPELALLEADFLQQRLSLTENGRQVLAGAVDASTYLDFDYWLGGVHFVRGKPMFRWNAAASKLELTQ